MSVSDPRPESQLLLRCARIVLTNGDAATVEQWLAGDLDWKWLLAMARRNAVLPLVALHLTGRFAQQVPADVYRTLCDETRRQAIRNLSLTGELIAVSRLFCDAGIDALWFKGPTLALAAYGDLSLRTFGDLDVLIRPGDFERAVEALTVRGYAPKEALTPSQQRAHVRSIGQLPVAAEPGGRVIDLHTSLTPRAYRVAVSMDDLWRRRETLSVKSHPVPVLSAEDLLLFLCVHGAKHLWRCLGWVCDVAELLRSRPNVDWRRLFSRAAEWRCKRILALGLLLAAEMLDAPCPGDVLSHARKDVAVRRLCDQVSGSWFRDHLSPPGGCEIAAFHLRAREHLLDSAVYAASLALTPTVADWRSVHVTAPLALFYYLVRPARLLGRFARRSTGV